MLSSPSGWISVFAGLVLTKNFTTALVGPPGPNRVETMLRVSTQSWM